MVSTRFKMYYQVSISPTVRGSNAWKMKGLRRKTYKIPEVFRRFLSDVTDISNQSIDLHARAGCINRFG